MRFRWQKYVLPNPAREKREWTPGRLRAAARAVKREQAAVPMFPDMAKYQTVEDRQAEIDSRDIAFARHHRNFRAESWRKVRAQLRALPAITRRGVLDYWNGWNGPSDPVYLLEMIRKVHRGESPYRWLRLIHAYRTHNSRLARLLLGL